MVVSEKIHMKNQVLLLQKGVGWTEYQCLKENILNGMTSSNVIFYVIILTYRASATTPAVHLLSPWPRQADKRRGLYRAQTTWAS